MINFYYFTFHTQYILQNTTVPADKNNKTIFDDKEFFMNSRDFKKGSP